MRGFHPLELPAVVLPGQADDGAGFVGNRVAATGVGGQQAEQGGDEREMTDDQCVFMPVIDVVDELLRIAIGLDVGVNTRFDIRCDLTVIEMEGWRRDYWFDQTGLPWIQPSPNLPTLDTATVYPGSVLVEGTGLSEGRGTTRPFEMIGAPYIHSRSFAEYLNGLGLPGVVFRPAHFQPTFNKWAGEMCGGIQIHVIDRNQFEPYLTGIAVISAVYALYPESFKWREPPYEYEYEKKPIEILCGGKEIPDMIRCRIPYDEIRASWQGDVEGFLVKRRQYLLYD